MDEKEMFTHCGKWYNLATLTPMYEEGKTHVNHYCDMCLHDVKSGVYSLPFS
ncbi:hypothetical protein ACIQY5_19185 [Peribacillus frigoritolerans]|uniref:hypothetical protein n=1 Tax=Peribacillus frigoritolerans TaxID=450367 RepID=UPI003806A6FF